jgi:hypothetical protein
MTSSAAPLAPPSAASFSRSSGAVKVSMTTSVDHGVSKHATSATSSFER